MQDTQDMSSNTNPYPAYTPASVTPAKPTTAPAPTIAQQTLERLVRMETLLLIVHRNVLLVGVLCVALLVGGAFLLGHVWR